MTAGLAATPNAKKRSVESKERRGIVITVIIVRVKVMRSGASTFYV